MFKLKAAKGCSILTSNPQNSTSQSRQGTADLTACEHISPSFKNHKAEDSSNKSVQGIQIRSSNLLYTHVNPTARSYTQVLHFYAGINYKNKTQIYEKCSPKSSRKPKIKSAHCTSKSRTRRAFGISQLVVPSFQTSINGKSKSQGVQRHQERQKQRLESMGNGDRK
ncbi:cysteine-rich receptor-like protein kinase 10-like [Dorcoceras hygrometricum]|uniref:Cysteine-rich receptor-like protein kinase 10-like n=1 Tax=Dorcoceras hygrometricum TaxID=472368 RepID=A0A2Z7B4U7_9LAMI|nr:cysteine-rich receptor-like protein kinase 10-like [Dorcoceras hygrometricum]